MIRQFIGGLIAAFLMVGCEKPTPVKTEEATLRMSFNRNPTTTDPRLGSDIVSTTLHFLLFEGLTKMEEDGSFVNALAERVELSSDKTTYTFYLKDALWADGTPLTAEDFARSWKTSLDPDFPCPNAHLFYSIKNAEKVKKGELSVEALGITAVNTKTFQVVLERPTPHFPTIISFSTFMPIHEGKGSLVTNGPFLLETFHLNDRIVLKKNPRYRNSNRVKLDKIEIAILDSGSSTLQLYEKGSLDLVISSLATLPLEALQEYKKQGTLRISSEPATTVCFFNTHKFPFNHHKIRSAFAFAVDRQSIVEHLTELGEAAATGPIPTVLKKNRSPFFKDGDGDAARRLLGEALEELHLKKPEDLGEITYSYFQSPNNKAIAQAIQQQWQDTLGVRVKLEQLEYQTHLSNLIQRRYTVAQGHWMAQYPDPMSIFERFYTKEASKNYSGWENQELQHLLHASYYAESPEERSEMLQKAEQLFVEHMPVCPLFHWSSGLLARPYLNLPQGSPLSGIFFENLSINLRERALYE